MKNVWVSSNLTINIKIRIFNITVKPVLLCGAETSFGSSGLRPSVTGNSGNGPSKNQQMMRSSIDTGDGFDTGS